MKSSSWSTRAQKILRRMQVGAKFARASCLGTDLTDQAFFEATNLGFTEPAKLARYLRNRSQPYFFIDPNHQRERINSFRAAFPDMQSQVVSVADQACRHIFDLLGSGPTQLGNPIDWHTDFKTGHRWKPNKYYAFVRPASYPGGYDIKVPWDLSCCHHFSWLGQAYWFTGDEKYAQAFVEQISGWIRDNPPQWGVNWASTIEVAIRAVNWLWGYHFFKASPALTDEFCLAFVKSLLIHGQHISHNLERDEQLTTNHYLANLVGLVYLGILLPEFKEADTWSEFGLRELERELFKQTNPDGTSFEASVSYHRLATELFLSATLLAKLNNKNFSISYMVRLEQMLDFIKHITQPDGTAPLIGDNDNGRLHRMKIWSENDRTREWNDFRYLLAIGAILFDRKDFATAAGDQWEEACWIYGERAFSRLEVTLKDPSCLEIQSKHFPDSGICILRSKGNYLAITAGPNGQNGNGGHAHNHALSINLHANGIAWLNDPGTYLYTADYHARDLFRSTASHNTISIDNAEINPLNPRSSFTLPDIARAEIKLYKHSAKNDLLWAIHYGYNRLPSPVTHHRQVYFHNDTPVFWLVRDVLMGTGEHYFKQSFLVGTAGITMISEGVLLQNKQKTGLALLWDSQEPLEAKTIQSWISPGYGQRFESWTVQRTGTVILPFEILTIIATISSERVTSDWIARTRAIGEQAYNQLPSIE